MVDTRSVSSDAMALLLAAVDGAGRIVITKSFRGTSITTKNKSFLENEKDRKAVARWEHALDELVRIEFIESTDSNGHVFQVKHTGYKVVEGLMLAASQPEAPPERRPLGFRTSTQEDDTD